MCLKCISFSCQSSCSTISPIRSAFPTWKTAKKPAQISFLQPPCCQLSYSPVSQRKPRDRSNFLYGGCVPPGFFLSCWATGGYFCTVSAPYPWLSEVIPSGNVDIWVSSRLQWVNRQFPFYENNFLLME